MRSIFKISPLARKLRCAALGMALASLTANAMAQSIVMSSTTSTEQSGLFGYLLPEFKKASGIDIKVVALGTGQALDMARRGDADVGLFWRPFRSDALHRPSRAGECKRAQCQARLGRTRIAEDGFFRTRQSRRYPAQRNHLAQRAWRGFPDARPRARRLLQNAHEG